MFDFLLREAESASPEHIQNTIRHAVDFKLWWDGFLHELSPIRCDLKEDSEYIELAQTYLDCLKEPKYIKKKMIKLILYCIADLPDVFNATNEDLFRPVI